VVRFKLEVIIVFVTIVLTASFQHVLDGPPEMPNVGAQRQGRKEVGIHERGVPCLEDAFRDGLQVEYLSYHGDVLLEMRDWVEYLPPRIFTNKDLTWLRTEEVDAEEDNLSID
jgi:hypothetical protein